MVVALPVFVRMMSNASGAAGWTISRSGDSASVKPYAASSVMAWASASRAVPRLVTAVSTSAAVVALAMAVLPAVRPLGERGQEGIVRDLADDAGDGRHRLALVDGAGRVLHQVGQRDAEVVELVGQVGIADLLRGDGGAGDGRHAGGDDLHRDFDGLGLGNPGDVRRGQV